LATRSLNLLIPSSFQPSNLLLPFVYSNFGREFRSSASRVLPHIACSCEPGVLCGLSTFLLQCSQDSDYNAT
jgi:hypothetical protein